MNSCRWVFDCFKKITFLMLLLSTTSTVYAVDKDCWADFYEEAEYAGKNLFIEGPTQLENLNNVNGDNWDKRIHSIKIGPKTKVTVFQNPRFELTLTEMAKKPDFMHAWGITEQDIKEDSELIFTGKEQIHDLGDFNFHKKIRSLKVECIK